MDPIMCALTECTLSVY